MFLRFFRGEQVNVPVHGRWIAGLIATVALLVNAGCEKSPSPQFRFNEVELLKLQKNKLGKGEKIDPAYRQQIGDLSTALFGTPDQPKFPFLNEPDSPAQKLISLDKLRTAAGPVSNERDGRTSGLYRKHCAHCHGITGDGAGPTATTLNPYPRDFRLGKYKFKSTPLRTPPTDKDLTTVLRNGIPGTAMPSFTTLEENEIAALVDYVKYLSIRGELERKLLDEATNRNGEPLFAIPAGFDPETVDAEIPKEFEDQLYELVGDYLNDEILARWLERDDGVTEIPDAPKSLDPKSPEFLNLALEGQKLFAGKANCVQCHGQSGLGDGQLANYDDWTNEWIKTPGVDITRQESYRDFLAAGALHPRRIRPRNLDFPIYRGGGSVGDLYLRIKNGIEGTPMPSSVSLTDEEVWAVVAFVKSLPYAEK
jgi:mono/diheme cytochrome c family protein